MLSHALSLLQEVIENQRVQETLAQMTAQTPRAAPSQVVDEAATLVATVAVTLAQPGPAMIPTMPPTTAAAARVPPEGTAPRSCWALKAPPWG